MTLKKIRAFLDSVALDILVLPGVLLILTFGYIPMVGIFLAFKKYRPAQGIWNSAWCGFDNFKALFNSPDIWVITRNTVLYNLAFIFLGKQICGLYTDDQWTISLAASVLVVAAIMQPLQSSQLILAGALRGAGDTKAVAFCTFVGIIIIRPLVSLTLINLFNVGLIGAWIAFLLDQSIRSVYTLVRFNSGKWQKITI